MIEPVGVATILVGLACAFAGERAPAVALVLATLLGSAAAVLVGAANIQPAHLMLAFVALGTLTRRREATAALRSLAPPSPGFWLACMVAWGLVGGWFLPRLLEGTTGIYAVGSSAYEATGATVPLGPVSGNLTQGIYLVADLACFAMVRAVCSTREGFHAVAGAFVGYAAANVGFALVDLATYATGTGWVLDPIRNAQYAFHLDEEAGGMKRIAGSFTEASSFAFACLGALGYTGTLALCGRRTGTTAALAAASLALLLLSTSTTGIVGAPAVLALLYATALRRCGGASPGRGIAGAVVVAGPPLAVLAVMALALDPAASGAVSDWASSMVLDKATSQSGIERGAWNAAAVANLVDTHGLGVGLGTSRASSFVLVLLSNLGIPGAALYAAFALGALWTRRCPTGSPEADASLAARNACLGLLAAGALSGTLVDQGLAFYALAALACAAPRGPATARRRRDIIGSGAMA